MSTYRAKQVDVSKFTIGEQATSDNGNKSAYLGYGGEKFFVQTPQLKVAFTMSKFGLDKDAKIEFQPGVVEKFGLQLTLNESCKSTKHFVSFIKALDKKVIDVGVANSAKWFKKAHSKEVVETFYSSSRAESKDRDKYADTFKINVPIKEGKIMTPCVDENDNPIEVEFPIRRGAQVTAILQFSSIWFVGNNKFGISQRPVLLKVTQSQNDFKSFEFQPDSDDDEVAGNEELIESSEDGDCDGHDIVAANTITDPSGEPLDELKEDAPMPPSDDDDEEDEPAKPPPKVIKKVVKKK